MPENKWGMSDDELLVANHIYKGFNKTPCKVGTYAAEDNIRKVFLLSAPLPTGITHIGTVGTFHEPVIILPSSLKICTENHCFQGMPSDKESENESWHDACSLTSQFNL